jgi:hypothetical protein
VWKRLKKAGWQYKNSGLLGARYIAPLGDCSEEYGRDEFTATPEILEGNVPARSEVVNTLRELFFRRGEDGRSMLLGIDTELDDLVNGVANNEQMIEEANERTEEELSPEVRALKHTVDLNNPVESVLLREDDTLDVWGRDSLANNEPWSLDNLEGWDKGVATRLRNGISVKFVESRDQEFHYLEGDHTFWNELDMGYYNLSRPTEETEATGDQHKKRKQQGPQKEREETEETGDAEDDEVVEVKNVAAAQFTRGDKVIIKTGVRCRISGKLPVPNTPGTVSDTDGEHVLVSYKYNKETSDNWIPARDLKPDVASAAEDPGALNLTPGVTKWTQVHVGTIYAHYGPCAVIHRTRMYFNKLTAPHAKGERYYYAMGSRSSNDTFLGAVVSTTIKIGDLIDIDIQGSAVAFVVIAIGVTTDQSRARAYIAPLSSIALPSAFDPACVETKKVDGTVTYRECPPGQAREVLAQALAACGAFVNQMPESIIREPSSAASSMALSTARLMADAQKAQRAIAASIVKDKANKKRKLEAEEKRRAAEEKKQRTAATRKQQQQQQQQQQTDKGKGSRRKKAEKPASTVTAAGIESKIADALTVSMASFTSMIQAQMKAQADATKTMIEQQGKVTTALLEQQAARVAEVERAQQTQQQSLTTFSSAESQLQHTRSFVEMAMMLQSSRPVLQPNSTYQNLMPLPPGMNRPFGLPPQPQLPLDWSKVTSETGDVYYYNNATHVSQWQIPTNP